MDFFETRKHFLDRFTSAGFRVSTPLSLVQTTITTSFLFSVGFVDVMEAVAGKSVELDGAATVQRCLRHFDMERVSDGRHLSFFEMAGALRCSNWQVSDLVSPLAQYLLQDCSLPVDRLHVTYFGGGSIGQEFLTGDDAAREAYLECGIRDQNIWAGDSSTNIWFEGANSGTERSGICGPHSEIFFKLDRNSGSNPLSQPEHFLELSNIVTITHQSHKGDRVFPVDTPLIELAVGMERLETVCGGAQNVYDSPKLHAITDTALSRSLGSRDSIDFVNALRVVVDHVRALTHLLADGALPGPKGRGHVVRRFFRRLLDYSSILQLDLKTSFPAFIEVIESVDAPINPNLIANCNLICDVFGREAARMQLSNHAST